MGCMMRTQPDATAQAQRATERKLRTRRWRWPTVGRGWAYVGAYLGASASIAANVAHSFVPWAGAPVGWSPAGGAVVSAVFWPVALLVAVEIFARTAWPAGKRWAALRWLGLVPVALVAAIVSYRHMSGLLTFYREDPVTALIGPLAVDSLMVIATAALIGTSPARRNREEPAPPVLTSAASENTMPGDARKVAPSGLPPAGAELDPDRDGVEGVLDLDIAVKEPPVKLADQLGVDPGSPGQTGQVGEGVEHLAAADEELVSETPEVIAHISTQTSHPAAPSAPFRAKAAERAAVFALYDAGTTTPKDIVNSLALDGMTVSLRTAQHWLAQRSNGRTPVAQR